MEWILVAQNVDKGRTFLKVVMSFRFREMRVSS